MIVAWTCSKGVYNPFSSPKKVFLYLHSKIPCQEQEVRDRCSQVLAVEQRIVHALSVDAHHKAYESFPVAFFQCLFNDTVSYGFMRERWSVLKYILVHFVGFLQHELSEPVSHSRRARRSRQDSSQQGDGLPRQQFITSSDPRFATSAAPDSLAPLQMASLPEQQSSCCAGSGSETTLLPQQPPASFEHDLAFSSGFEGLQLLGFEGDSPQQPAWQSSVPVTTSWCCVSLQQSSTSPSDSSQQPSLQVSAVSLINFVGFASQQESVG